jgi:hypothetical protein
MKIILIILQITFPLILTENITFSKYKLHSNKLKYFHSFIYNNYSKNNAPIKQGFNYSFDIPKDNSHEEYSISKISIILSQSNFNIKSKLIDDLCIDGIESLKNKSKLYDKILYYDEVVLNKKKENENNNLYLKNGNTFYIKGIAKAYLLYCNYKLKSKQLIKESTSISISGSIWFFNTNSYDSAENFYRVTLYSLLTFYYFSWSIFWIIKMVLNHEKINLLMTLFSINVPLILLENIMRLEFFVTFKNIGKYSFSFKSAEIFFRLIKNSIIRIIFYIITTGFIATNRFKFEFKKIGLFALAFILYFFFDVGYEITLVSYQSDFINHNYGFLPLFSFFLLGTNGYIWYYLIYIPLLNLSIEYEKKKLTKEKKLIDIISYSLYILLIICFAYSIMFLFCQILNNTMTLCYIKWITDLLEQSISLGLFTLLCYILKPNENPVYIFDKELNQSVGIKDNGSNNHNSNSVSNNNDNVTKLDDDSNNHSVNESDKDNENKFKVDIKENENK